MSWGEYLSNLKKEGLKHAAICGTDNASWVQVSDGSNVRSFPERIVSCSKLLSLIFRDVGVGDERVNYQQQKACFLSNNQVEKK